MKYPLFLLLLHLRKVRPEIRDARELRVKESDRLKAVSEGFNVLGIMHENFEDGMSIQGTPNKLLIDQSISIESYQ